MTIKFTRDLLLCTFSALLLLSSCQEKRSENNKDAETKEQLLQNDEADIIHLVSQKINGDQIDGISLDTTVSQIKKIFHIRQSMVCSATPTVDNGVLRNKRMTWTLNLQMDTLFGSDPDARPNKIQMQIGLTENASPQAAAIAAKVAEHLNTEINQQQQIKNSWRCITYNMGNIYITLTRNKAEQNKPTASDENTFDFTSAAN
ncbi:MAG: hypothetical protein ILA34_04665 [Bacteroidaceae bacterium]|nr:hypothetical protein [Bacteroidaceae bacterium]